MKTVVVPLGWMPICEKRFMFEMTASFTLTPDKPGRPQFDLPHKLQQQHRAMFPEKELISENSGRLLAEWAKGGKAPGLVVVPAADQPAPASSDKPSGAGTVPDVDHLETMAREAAQRGRSVLRGFLSARTKAERDALKPIYGELEGLIPAEAE
jgi:hypothetical protein